MSLIIIFHSTLRRTREEPEAVDDFREKAFSIYSGVDAHMNSGTGTEHMCSSQTKSRH